MCAIWGGDGREGGMCGGRQEAVGPVLLMKIDVVFTGALGTVSEELLKKTNLPAVRTP